MLRVIKSGVHCRVCWFQVRVAGKVHGGAEPRCGLFLRLPTLPEITRCGTLATACSCSRSLSAEGNDGTRIGVFQLIKRALLQ